MAEQQAPEWQATTEVLMLIGEDQSGFLVRL
jgi:hypothetical protein